MFEADAHYRERASPSPKVDVEVILVSREHNYLIVQSDEDAKPISVLRRKARVLHYDGKLMTLRLSESNAISYNLV